MATWRAVVRGRERLLETRSLGPRPKYVAVSSRMTAAGISCAESGMRSSRALSASSVSIVWCEREAKAATRRSAPSSSRMLCSNFEAM